MCGQCKKKIVDFTKSSWTDIETIQNANNQSVCGIYSNRQLKHWGETPPRTSKPAKTALAASSLLLALSQVPAKNSSAQTVKQLPIILPKQDTTASPQVQIPPAAVANNTFPKIVIEGHVTIASEDKQMEPLAFANVGLLSLGPVGTTDFDGYFRVEIARELDSLQKDSLEISYIGYQTLVLSLADLTAENNHFKAEMLENYTDQISIFYVRRSTIWRRAYWKVRNLFR